MRVRSFHRSSDRILYHERGLLALNKRPGEPVQPDKSGDAALSQEAAQILGRNSYIVHRIDRPVSGVVLFAANKKLAAALGELFREGRVEKLYWAVVDAAPPTESGTLEHLILRRPGNRSVARPAERLNDRPTDSARSREGGLSRLSYRTAGRSDRYWLLEVRPQTGRHHQIRAQLAAIGCHIKGDLKYGARRSNPGGGIELHARAVSFPHPRSGEPTRIIAPPPAGDSLWELFAGMVE